MSERLPEDLWQEVLALLEHPSAPDDPAKREVLVAHLRAQPEVWPHFVAAMKREIAERDG